MRVRRHMCDSNLPFLERKMKPMQKTSNLLKPMHPKQQIPRLKTESLSVKKERLELLTIQWEYPNGYSGTVTPVQYAYFLDKNGDVIKKQLKVSL